MIVTLAVARLVVLQRAADVIAAVNDDPAVLDLDPLQLRWLVAEFGLVLWLRGLSIREYLASRDPVSQTVYYLMLGMFAIMPFLIARR